MAKKFSFRLDTVLKLRSYKVKLAKEVLLQIQSQRIKAEEEINRNHQELQSLYRNKVGKISVETIQQDFYRQEYIKNYINILEKEKEKLLKIEEAKRKILNEAMKDEKILLKLKDKKIAEYKFEMNQEDQKVMDDIAINLKKDDREVEDYEVSYEL